MSSLRNNVRLIGHLGMDPAYTKFESGREVVRFRLATTENYKDKVGNWQTATQWHTIFCWGTLAYRVVQQLKKGSYITLDGSLQYSNYTDAAGIVKYITEIKMEAYINFDKHNTHIPASKEADDQLTAVQALEPADDELPF